MAGNDALGSAKSAKNDEFYTQYGDIEAEMNAYVEYDPDVFRGKTVLLPCDDPEWSEFTLYFAANFDRFGLKKLISTSYAWSAGSRQLTLFEQGSPLFDEEKHPTHGKLFTLERDADGSGRVDTDDIEFRGYLEGDGDFRSAEVRALRDEADVIITNPPFSLFREFLSWILEAGKRFVIIGSKNAITYKEVFPLLKENKIWLGPGFPGGNAYFRIDKESARSFASGVYDPDTGLVKFRNVGWFTNIDHGLRHQPLLLDTMEHNLKFNKKLRKKLERDYGKIEYPRYDNYDAIEVPFTECIPSDYEAAMGVPITFLDKWDPSQFEVVGADFDLAEPEPLPDGGSGTGRFYVRERESTALVLALGHTEEEMRAALAFAGVPDSEMRWCSGAMGVPITFLDRYNPEQFEIVGGTANGQVPSDIKLGEYKTYNNPLIGDRKIYQRIVIRPKRKGCGQ